MGNDSGLTGERCSALCHQAVDSDVNDPAADNQPDEQHQRHQQRFRPGFFQRADVGTKTADGKTRKDGKEASPKDNRTGYETQTTELSKVLTPQTLGKNCRRKNRKTVASSSDHTSPPKSDKPKIPNKEMKLSSCLTVVPYSFESSF